MLIFYLTVSKEAAIDLFRQQIDDIDDIDDMDFRLDDVGQDVDVGWLIGG